MIDQTMINLDFHDLVVKRLVQMRRHDHLPITLYKYHRKVFYKGLFTEDERLRWARGIALDDDGNIVLRPFYKWYNYHENEAGEDWNDTDLVLAVQKHNGFMMSVTAYNGELVYASTGTFDSDYVKLGRRYIEEQCKIDPHELSRLDATLVFEVCAEEDPHIVKEVIGVYLIGVHRNSMNCKYGFESENGVWYPPDKHENYISFIASAIGAYEAEHFYATFGEVKSVLSKVQHEGFMVYNLSNQNVREPVIKLKSPYYLVTKLLARHKLSQGAEPNFGVLKNRVDEEFYPVIDWLKGYPEFFEKDEQTRIKELRAYFENNL